MSDLKESSSTGSHRQQQDPHSLQYRKTFESDECDWERLQPLQDSDGQADHTINLSNSDTAEYVTLNPPDKVTEQSNTSSTSNPQYSSPVHLSDNVVHKKPFAPDPSNSSTTQPPTPSSPRRNPNDHLTISDLTLLTLILSPALLHLWARCFAAPTSTPRQFGTWFALLTFPLSTPLYRWEPLPLLARDVLELMSYGSAWTISVDVTVLLYGHMIAYGPSQEWEWVIFCPGVVTVVACWAVVVGFLWGLVIV